MTDDAFTPYRQAQAVQAEPANQPVENEPESQHIPNPASDYCDNPCWAREALQEVTKDFGVTFGDESNSDSRACDPPTGAANNSPCIGQTTARPPTHPQSRPPLRSSSNSSGGTPANSESIRTFRNVLEKNRKHVPRHLSVYAKVERNFYKVDEYDEKNRRVYFRCVNCGTAVHNRKASCGKMYHLIVCPGLPKPERAVFHAYCNNKNKPPILTNPVPGLTPSTARRMEAEEIRQTRSRANTDDDAPRIPRFGQQMIAQRKLKPSTKIVECSEKEQKIATDLLLELIVDEDLPFAICDTSISGPRPLARLLAFLRPGFKLPLGHRVGGDLLNRFYNETMKDVKGRLQNMLQDCRGTLMFDGSEDVNGAPMINVLLRVMGTSRVDTVTFFLTTVYTGYDTVDANYYASMAERVIKDFVGFEHIAGITTDNTGSVKNARERLEEQHGRVVASQDQAHVADRLLADIGDIGWVAATLKTLSGISTDLRRFRKLRARLIEFMKEYNSSLPKIRTVENCHPNELDREREGVVDRPSGRTDMERNAEESGIGHGITTAIRTRVDDDRERADTDTRGVNRNVGDADAEDGRENAEDRARQATEGGAIVDQVHDTVQRNTGQRTVFETSQAEADSTCSTQAYDYGLESVILPNYPSYERVDPGSATDSEGEEDEDVRIIDAEERVEEARAMEPRRKRARLMKKVSAVRFASCEKLLDEYLSLRPVLLTLVDDPLFDVIYTAKSSADKVKRNEVFVKPIRDEELFLRVQQLHAILAACRTYLRIFDSETALVSEVFETTLILQETLEKLPSAFFPEPREQNRKELLDIFANRKEGPLPGHKKIKIRLLSDLHIAAALLDPYRTPVREEDYMDAFRRHLDGYLSGINWDELDIQEGDRNEFVEEMLAKYAEVRSIWRRKGLLKEHSESSTTRSDPRPSSRSRRMRSPAAWWVSGSITKPRDVFERKAVEELIEFARRTLSVSPTATAAERTFSLEGRIHGKDRASLGQQKIRKILFCRWNARLLRKLALRDGQDEVHEVERQTEHINKLRGLRVAAERAREAECSLQSSVEHDSTDQNAPFNGGYRREEDQREYQSQQPVAPSAAAPSIQNTTRPYPFSARTTDQRLDVNSRSYPDAPAQNMPAMMSTQMPSVPVMGEPFSGWMQVMQATVAAFPTPGAVLPQTDSNYMNPAMLLQPGQHQSGRLTDANSAYMQGNAPLASSQPRHVERQRQQRGRPSVSRKRGRDKNK